MIDPSIPLQIQTPAPLNPLQLAMQGQQLKGMQLNNNQLMQAMQSNQAVSQAVKDNTDAQGNVNLAGVQSQIAKDPNATYNLQQATSTNLGQQGQQISNGTAQMQQIQQKLGFITSQLGTMANNPNTSPADLTATVASGVQKGIFDPKEASAILSEPDFPKSQSDVQPWIAKHLNAFTGAQNQLSNMAPGGGVVNTGNQTAIVNTNNPNLTGQQFGSPAAVYNQQMTPGDVNSPMQVVGPNGQPQWTTKGQVINQVNAANSQFNGMTNGRTPQQQSSQLPAAGLAPGQTEAMRASAQASAKAAADLSSSVQDAPTRITLLKKAIDELNTGDVKTGIGTENLRNVTAAISNAVPGIAQAMGIDPTKIQSQDELNKLLTQYASRQSAALGTGTDAKLAAALTGNANMHVSALANDDILRYTVGIEKMNQAKNMAWQQYQTHNPTQAGNFNNWSAQWNQTNDPRAYMLDEMTQAQQKKMFSTMSQQDLAKLRQTYNNAYSDGLMGQ